MIPVAKDSSLSESQMSPTYKAQLLPRLVGEKGWLPNLNGYPATPTTFIHFYLTNNRILKQSSGPDPRISAFHERAAFVGELSLSDSLQSFGERKDPLGKHWFCRKRRPRGTFSWQREMKTVSGTPGLFSMLKPKHRNRQIDANRQNFSRFPSQS